MLPQKWYNIRQIDMSEKVPMVDAANVPLVRCSAAYPTGRELMFILPQAAPNPVASLR